MPQASQIDITEIKRRAIVGFVALVSRSFIVQIIALVSQFVLSVFLNPSTYGVYYLVGSVVNFLAYFSDIGLAGALIQKKESLTSDDLRTTFTVQQILVAILILLLFIFTPTIKLFFGIDPAGVYLLWAMGVSLLLSSFKTIPSVILERNIQFDKLIIPVVLETLSFNLVAVYLAWNHWGITTFTIAVLVRGFVGLVAMYVVSPWKPSLGISKQSLSHLLKFGIPYQINTFLAVIKDDGMTIVLGKLIGQNGLGYIGWAKRNAELPMRMFMDNLTKVAFPTFARLQHDRTRLTKAIEISIKYLTLLLFPIFTAMAFLIIPLIYLIPNYTKWLPAVTPLYLYLFNAAWASISTMMTNALNAIGKIKTTFKLMVMWTVLTWVLMPIFAIKWGYLGVSYSVGLIALSSLAVIMVIKRMIGFGVYRSLGTPTIASTALGLYLLILRPYATTLPLFMCISTGGVLTYLFMVYLLEGKAIFLTTINHFLPDRA